MFVGARARFFATDRQYDAREAQQRYRQPRQPNQFAESPRIRSIIASTVAMELKFSGVMSS